MSSYTITSYDGNFTIQPDTIDTSNTALILPGKDWSGWGEAYSNNFTHLLENFALGEPSVKRTGQLWYNPSTKTLNIWNKVDNTWVSTNKLSNPIHINLSGPVTGSTTNDGISDINITTTLTPTGVVAGNYLSANITVGADGRILSAGNGVAGSPSFHPVNSFNSRTGDVTLTSSDVTGALTYDPNTTFLKTVTYSDVTTALNYVPANDALTFHKTGDQMYGDINMSSHRVLNLPQPSSTISTEAARMVDVTNAVNTKTQRVFNGSGETSYNVTVSSNPPSGGNDGDVWYRY